MNKADNDFTQTTFGIPAEEFTKAILTLYQAGLAAANSDDPHILVDTASAIMQHYGSNGELQVTIFMTTILEFAGDLIKSEANNLGLFTDEDRDDLVRGRQLRLAGSELSILSPQDRADLSRGRTLRLGGLASKVKLQ